MGSLSHASVTRIFLSFKLPIHWRVSQSMCPSLKNLSEAKASRPDNFRELRRFVQKTVSNNIHHVGPVRFRFVLIVRLTTRRELTNETDRTRGAVCARGTIRRVPSLGAASELREATDRTTGTNVRLTVRWSDLPYYRYGIIEPIIQIKKLYIATKRNGPRTHSLGKATQSGRSIAPHARINSIV